jgi:SAM-dependent methyltransferase
MRFEFHGHCPICEDERSFVAERQDDLDPRWHGGWFRGDLKCTVCRAPPRERVIADALNRLAPGWRHLDIHECSPGGWAFSYKLRAQAPKYVATQYDTGFPFGQMHASGKWRNEDLERQTFADESFDIVITQDVFEHLFHPGRAMREIARTLRPGGFALMTVPVVRGWGPTQRRARIVHGQVEHLLPPEYHGNPVGDGRSLVTVDWSYHIGSYLAQQSGLSVTVSTVDDLGRGIRDPWNTLVVAHKGAALDLGD